MTDEKKLTAPKVEELYLLHANICQALGDPKRIQILYALSESPMRVSDLAEFLDVPQPSASRHLAILRQRALIISERNGNEVIYNLASNNIIDVLDDMRVVLREAIARQTKAIY